MSIKQWRDGLTAFLLLLVLVGCGSVPGGPGEAAEAGDRETAAKAEEETGTGTGEQAKQEKGDFAAWTDGPLPDRFRREPKPEAVKKDLVQLFRLMQGYDYFAQFTRGDSIFEDYMVTYFGIEDGPYYPGKGVERTVYDQDGTTRSRIATFLLKELQGEEGAHEGRWWRIEHEQEKASILYETRVGPYGVPREIRFRRPAGGYGSRSTMLGQSVQQAASQMAPEEIRDRLNEERGEELRDYLPPFFARLEEQGRETLEVAGRRLYTIRFEASGAEGADAGGRSPLLWYSPDVPGGIVRISFGDELFVEISDWSEGAEQLIEEEMVDTAEGRARSMTGETAQGQSFAAEGSPSEPVKLEPGEPHRGSVTADGTSYYAVIAPQRSDLTIELRGQGGAAALYSYGEDGSFDEWLTGSEGGSPSLTEYYVERGTTFYFTVESLDASGMAYTLQVSADPLLDSLGVRARGDYLQRTEPLQEGENRLLVLPGGLNYYELAVEEGDTVQLRVDGLQPGQTRFSFLDVVSGSYGSASSMQRSPQKKEITLGGLEAGSRLIFFLVASREAREAELTITVEE